MTIDNEYDANMARYIAAMEEQAQRKLAEASDQIARFTALATAQGLKLDAGSFEYIDRIGIVAKASGIARVLLGSISVERDGLLPFNKIADRLPPSRHWAGYFVGSDYTLMAHPCYRRQMHHLNNWAPRFIDLFWSFDILEVERYIAIDEDRVRIDVDDLCYVELDTWFGAPFDQDVRNIKSGIVKLRPPLDIESHYVSSLFADVYCLDIKWSESDNIKTFQALEIKTERIQVEREGRLYFPARYLHAEFDLTANCFRHFDGAIQLFTEEEYFQRRDSDFNMTLKNSAHVKARSHKVFKINGSLSTDLWVEFCSHFLTANPLTFEYFSGHYPEHVTEILTRIRERH